MSGSATKRIKLSDEKGDQEPNIRPQAEHQSSYFSSSSKSADERENSDSGFTEIESSRTSQDDTGDDLLMSSHHNSGSCSSSSGGKNKPFLDPYADETIRDCSFPDGSACNYPEPEDEEYDDDDDSSSSVSRLSGLSHLSGSEDTPLNPWLRKQIISGVSPRDLLSQLVQSSDIIPAGVSDITLWRIIANSLETPRRQKLKQYHSFEHAVELIRSSENIVVLTGAGVSVSCGIPDFRSRDGIYSRLSKEYPDLPDPQAMFDIRYFSQDPRPFFKFAREIYPGQFKPSPCHQFIKLLESKNKLLRNYTQNIDTLEQVAGIRNIIECHGSFATASCTKCKARVVADQIRADVFNQKIPICQICNPGAESPDSTALNANPEETKVLVERGIMKPDIVFFGEGLPDLFHETIESDRNKCDLLIVIGSSLKVRPVAMIPNWISPDVPQILINREPLYHMDMFDMNLLGDSDVIAQHLCSILGETWNCSDENVSRLAECTRLLELPAPEPKAVVKPKTSAPTPSIDVPAGGSSSPPDTDADEDEEKQYKMSLSERLPPESYYKLTQRVYIFHGAEVYLEELNSDDDDDEYEEDDADDSELEKKPDEPVLPQKTEPSSSKSLLP